MNMKKKALFASMIGAALMLSCGSNSQQADLQADINGQHQTDGDSTIYGLACDGCTDTILVILRDVRKDPDTLNILEASRRHRVFGSLNIGHKVAVMRNAEDSTVGDIVIDMGSLRGKWCYKVMPVMRRRANMQEKTEEQLLQMLPDSLRELLMTPREYGFHLIGEGSIRPIGEHQRALTSDDKHFVDYPTQPRYRDWKIANGLLVFSEVGIDSLGKQQTAHSDTAQLELLTPDTLVLRFKDRLQGYYKK